jgi:hypothetical protein
MVMMSMSGVILYQTKCFLLEFSERYLYTACKNTIL